MPTTPPSYTATDTRAKLQSLYAPPPRSETHRVLKLQGRVSQFAIQGSATVRDTTVAIVGRLQ